MSAWHRPDVETAALEYLTAAVGDPTGARQIVDGLLARGRDQRAAEMRALAQQVEDLERKAAVVAEFVAARAEYITAIRNCHPDNGHDYDRWQGHAAARRQLAEKLGLPIAWPAGGAS